jgi:hypothetical protein
MDNGIFGMLGNFLSSLFGGGGGGQGGGIDLNQFSQNYGHMPFNEIVQNQELLGKLGLGDDTDDGGIFGNLFNSKALPGLGALGLGYYGMRNQQQQNKEAQKLANRQQNFQEKAYGDSYKSFLENERYKQYVRTHGAAPLRNINSSGQIEDRGVSNPTFHLPVEERMRGYS